jgi:hypothetical protein
MGIKVLTLVFIIFAWSRIAVRVKNGHARTLELILWTIIWITIGVAAFIPRKTDVLAQFLGVGRGFDALVFIAILTLFYSVYRIYSKITSLERDITKLTKELALKETAKK